MPFEAEDEPLSIFEILREYAKNKGAGR